MNEKDWTTLGYGLPSLSSSWHNRLTFKHLQIDFILRGVFGHSIVNSDRLYFENNSDSDKERNRIRTSLAEPNLKYAFYGSLFVEDASFIRLDNLQVSYNFDLKRSRFLKKLTLQFAAQNLFTMTNFTGDDPEVRYDVKSESYGYPHLFGTQSLVYGMENQYSETRLTRTFSIGLKAGF